MQCYYNYNNYYSHFVTIQNVKVVLILSCVHNACGSLPGLAAQRLGIGNVKTGIHSSLAPAPAWREATYTEEFRLAETSVCALITYHQNNTISICGNFTYMHGMRAIFFTLKQSEVIELEIRPSLYPRYIRMQF